MSSAFVSFEYQEGDKIASLPDNRAALSAADALEWLKSSGVAEWWGAIR